MQHEEQGRDEEPEPDEQQPRVVVALRGPVDDEREAHVHPRDEGHQPEVRRVVLDEQVGGGHREQQPQPEQRQRQVEQPHHQPDRDASRRHATPSWQNTRTHVSVAPP